VTGVGEGLDRLVVEDDGSGRDGHAAAARPAA
jgi:hypothetical protein